MSRNQQHFPGTPSFAPLYESHRSAGVPETAAYLRGAACPAWVDVLVDFRLESERAAVLPGVLPVAERMWPSTTSGWSMHAYVFVPDEAPDHAVTGKTVRQMLTRTGQEKPPTQDGVTVLLLCDPEGFRFGFVVSCDKPGRSHTFASGRLATLLPGLGLLMLAGLATTNPLERGPSVSTHPFDGTRRPNHGASTHQEGACPDVVCPDLMDYDVAALRDAVADPHTWLGLAPHRATGPDTTAADPVDVDVAAYEFTGPFRPLSGLRALLAWSLAGVRACGEETRAWIEGGLDPVEASAWLAQGQGRVVGAPSRAPSTGSGQPTLAAVPEWAQADVIEWFSHLGGGRKNREYARACRVSDLTPDEAKRWVTVLRDRAMSGEAGARQRATVRAFEAADWTAEDALNVERAIYDDRRAHDASHYTGPSTSGRTVLEWAAEWTIVPATTAIAHMRAGITPDATRTLIERDEMPNQSTLAVLAGLRQPAFTGPRW